MTDDATATEPRSEPERRLTRPREGRMLAGVCAGLGRYFDLDPLVYRVAFAALVLLGGSGILLYVAAWLVMPEEGEEDSILGQALRERRHRPWLLVGVGVVAFALIVGVSSVDAWPDPTDVWLAALAAGIAVLAWQLRGRAPRTGGGVPGAEAGPSAAGAAGSSRRPVFLPALGALIAAAGVLVLLQALDVVDVDWTLALASAVILVGLAVAVGAFFGRAGALAAFGLALLTLVAIVAAVDLPLKGPIGERTERPAGASELEPGYELSIGRLVVDLRQVVLPPGSTAVSTSVGIGELVVYVPPDVTVHVAAHATAGDTEVFGRSEDGWDVDQTFVVEVPGEAAPELVLEADVGFGSLEIHEG